MKKKLLCILILLSNVGLSTEMKSIMIPAKSSKNLKDYKLELVEFINGKSGSENEVALFVPGYFQNAYSWHLLPEKGISIVDYLSKKYPFKFYSIQPNGIGKSDYVKKSNTDDIAIDDISYAVYYLQKKYNKKIYLIGHSNGSITLQAYLGGLSRSPILKKNKKGKIKKISSNVFNEKIANSRQKLVKAVGLSAGNICMTDDDNGTGLDSMAKFGLKIKWLNKRIGWINAKLLTKFLSPTKIFKKWSFAYHKFWEFLYHRENVSDEARKALYDKTLSGTSANTLVQYSEGVVNGCIRATSGQTYQEGLRNINVPVFQMTYDLDPMAVPEYTKKDDFDHINSVEKEFIAFPNQGHEDFMMNAKYHKNLDWLFDRFMNYSNL